MLAHLRVRELVLIENLDLELSNGFNAMTGETGGDHSSPGASQNVYYRHGLDLLEALRQWYEHAFLHGIHFQKKLGVVIVIDSHYEKAIRT
jgi:hypothetical protein